MVFWRKNSVYLRLPMDSSTDTMIFTFSHFLAFFYTFFVGTFVVFWRLIGTFFLHFFGGMGDKDTIPRETGRRKKTFKPNYSGKRHYFYFVFQTDIVDSRLNQPMQWHFFLEGWRSWLYLLLFPYCRESTFSTTGEFCQDIFSKHRPFGPMISISRFVRVCVHVSVHFWGTG